MVSYRMLSELAKIGEKAPRGGNWTLKKSDVYKAASSFWVLDPEEFYERGDNIANISQYFANAIWSNNLMLPLPSTSFREKSLLKV